MLEAALAGLIAGYAIAIPVGAIAVLIIHAAVSHGLRTGLAAGAGAASADLVYATIAVIVGAAAATLIARIQAPLARSDLSHFPRPDPAQPGHGHVFRRARRRAAQPGRRCRASRIRRRGIRGFVVLAERAGAVRGCRWSWIEPSIRLATAIVGNTIVLGFGVLIASRALPPGGSL